MQTSIPLFSASRCKRDNKSVEERKDLEGMQIMRTLGKNMAWLLKSIQAGKDAGILLPEKEPRAVTNFIR